MLGNRSDDPHAETKALYDYGRLHQVQCELQQACQRRLPALAILTCLGERLYAERGEEAEDG